MSTGTPAANSAPQPIPKLQVRGPNRQELLFRVVVIVVILCSLVLAWWSIERLVPRQKQSRALTSAVTHLSDAVQDLERKWTSSDVEQIRQNYKEVHSQLFADEAALRAWLGNLQEQATRLDLELKIEFGKST